MTESAIIAMVMVIIFACMWAAVSYEHAKIRVMDEARAQSWGQALAGTNCSGGGEDLSGQMNANSQDANSDATPDTSGIDSTIPVAGNAAFSDSGYVTVELKRNVQFPGLIGGKSYTMWGRMHMRCNEKPNNDDGDKYFWIALGSGAIAAIVSALL
jgi:hypothetical protein